MKKMIRTISLILIFALALSLTACSSYGKVEKALKGIGYAVVENSNEAENYTKDTEIPVTAHILTNKDSLEGIDKAKTNVVVVLEFKATEDLVNFYKESNAFQGLIEDAKEDGTIEEIYNALAENGFVNGNCIVISTNPVAMLEVCEAVKNA